MSEIVQQLECATPCKGQRRTQDVGTSSSGAPTEHTVKAATKSKAIVHGDEEMCDFEDKIGKRSDDKE